LCSVEGVSRSVLYKKTELLALAELIVCFCILVCIILYVLGLKFVHCSINYLLINCSLQLYPTNIFNKCVAQTSFTMVSKSWENACEIVDIMSNDISWFDEIRFLLEVGKQLTATRARQLTMSANCNIV